MAKQTKLQKRLAVVKLVKKGQPPIATLLQSMLIAATAMSLASLPSTVSVTRSTIAVASAKTTTYASTRRSARESK